MPMNLTHLRAFHYVATHGSYVAAAASAGVSQPTLSEQVRLLEGQHEVRLLQRAGRSVELTVLGQKLFAVTSKLFAAEMEAEAVLAKARQVMQGELRFGTDAPINAVGVLSAFRRRNPGVSIQLVSGNSAEIRKRVLAGTVDVGIIADETPHPDLIGRTLGTQDLVAFVRHDHALAGAKVIKLRDLVHHPLIIREPGSITRRSIETALQAAHLKPTELLETDSREAVHAAVIAGLGVGVIAEDEFNDDPRLVLLDFGDRIPPITEYLVYRADNQRSHVVDAVLGCVGG
ncbi:LysR substrate-binding domain-containing protein [Arthrobacter sp. AK01]|uniref:LysR substrate-binding domain-containing protein n=1 Tax=Micrococcaceae TaxID=1268 RepID=UPI001E37DC94|nr:MULTISPECIES: LysR substrate-binding domain-containing protein [Micrococcaceae]MCD4850567.1 LysR substrate-binding domain-containing protein [Arthrobacter sp. AK01]MCP1411806.1 aminoethylphosphonate catabolism LysR family transcriptional regulator [Paenarthrobacter sp. A20]